MISMIPGNARGSVGLSVPTGAAGKGIKQEFCSNQCDDSLKVLALESSPYYTLSNSSCY